MGRSMDNKEVGGGPSHLVTEARFGFLLLMLSLIALQIIPAFLPSDYVDRISAVMITIVLLAALYLVAYSRKELLIGLLMAVPILLSIWWLSGHDYALPPSLHFSLAAVYLSYIVVHIFRYVFETHKVSMDMMYAGVCIYLLLGMIWTMIYTLLEIHAPGSFKLGLEQPTVAVLQSQLNYFSYVTLATLGYGDIVPLSPMAQSLASLEAIVGQFYLAFVVARLVALQIMTASRQ